MRTVAVRQPAELVRKQPAVIVTSAQLEVVGPAGETSAEISTATKVVLRVASVLFLLAAVYMAWCAATGHRL